MLTVCCLTCPKSNYFSLPLFSFCKKRNSNSYPSILRALRSSNDKESVSAKLYYYFSQVSKPATRTKRAIRSVSSVQYNHDSVCVEVAGVIIRVYQHQNTSQMHRAHNLFLHFQWRWSRAGNQSYTFYNFPQFLNNSCKANTSLMIIVSFCFPRFTLHSDQLTWYLSSRWATCTT